MVKEGTKRVTTETVHDDGTKKTIVKEVPIKKSPKLSQPKKMTAREREELLIENFVGLQHAMTNMSVKFGQLSDNISKLLEVFEESAKNYMQGGKSDDKDMLVKINSLLEQNKTIAKGLVLMEGKLRGRSEAPQQMPPQNYPGNPAMQQPRPKPLPTA